MPDQVPPRQPATGREPIDLDDAVALVLGEGARLRAAQADALRALTERDPLLVARSAAGKTAVHALATLLTARLTVVGSPLLALQRGRADSLSRAGLRAAALSSAVPARARRDLLSDAAEGALDVVPLGPEQLARPDILAQHTVVEHVCDHSGPISTGQEQHAPLHKYPQEA